MNYEKGQTVRLLYDIVDTPSGDSPGCFYAKAGDLLIIKCIHDPIITHHIYVHHPEITDGRSFCVAADEIEPYVETPPVHYPGTEHIVPLAPCPLCGNSVDFVEYPDDTVWMAECTECGLTLGFPHGYSSRLDLCEDWNRRTH